MSSKKKRIIFVLIGSFVLSFIISYLLRNVNDAFVYIAILSFFGAGTTVYILVDDLTFRHKKSYFHNFDPDYYLFRGRINRNAIVDIVIYLMRLDNVITEYEDRRFEAFLKANFPKSVVNEVFGTYLKRKTKDLQHVIDDVAWLSDDLDFRMKLRLIDLLGRTATFDKLLSDKETKFITEVSERLGVNSKTMWAILDRHDFIEEKDIKDKHENKKKVFSTESFLLQKLDLEEGATDVEIKKRYRDLVKQYHPDKLINASDKDRLAAELKFIEIQEAYDKIQALRNN